MSINTTSAYGSPTIPGIRLPEVRLVATTVSTFPSRTIHCVNHTECLIGAEILDMINFQKRLIISMIILLTFIIFLATLGNTLVLVATWRERSLHQPNKYFIACLAVADLLVGFFVAPSHLYIDIVRHKLYHDYTANIPQLNENFCRFVVWMETISLAASIYTLTFISLDRYLKISKPLQSRMTTSRSLKIIFITWLVSSCFATYAASPGSGSRGILNGARFCDIERDSVKLNRFYTSLITIAFFLPTIILLIMYALIFVVVHKRKKMMRNGELGQTNNDENQRTTFRKDLKVITMLLIVVGLFMICWCPSVIYFFMANYYPNFRRDVGYKSRDIFETIAYNLPLLNSVCNPITYACLDQTYKLSNTCFRE